MPKTSLSSDGNSFIKNIYNTLKRHPKRIVFPDGEDIRVLRVAAQMVKMEMAVPILLGNHQRIHLMAEEEDISMLFVRVIDPSTSQEIELFCSRLQKVSRYKGKEIANPREIVCRPHNFAAMMVQYGHADGMVGGNLSMPTVVFRAASTMIKPLKHVSQEFSSIVMVPPPHLKNFGGHGILFLSDCGVIPSPDVKELATIAVETGKFAQRFLNEPPRIAMLSHSTLGSSVTESSLKVAAATQLARQYAAKEFLEMHIDGELQADVALDPMAAEIKRDDGKPKDPADVLVFPNLDSSHIAIKLLRHVAGAQNYGQFIMGLTRPAAQVPRTVSEEALLGTAAIVGVQAITFNNTHIEENSLNKESE